MTIEYRDKRRRLRISTRALALIITALLSVLRPEHPPQPSQDGPPIILPAPDTR